VGGKVVHHRDAEDAEKKGERKKRIESREQWRVNGSTRDEATGDHLTFTSTG
jgi:hypothetical protein